jgi:ATP-dependent Lhr-like helicase
VEITHDRVYVTPAGAEPGKMPFWRAEGAGRAFEFGEAIGALLRRLEHLPEAEARAQLAAAHHLGNAAVDVLLAYLQDQREATRELPTDRLIVVERFRDEIGDWRVCVLSPFGARVHAAWVTAVSARMRALVPGEIEMFWTDDGFAFRLPDQETVPDLSALFPTPEEVEDLVVAHLAETSLFAARFRENAARALLLPKRDPKRRTPLWQIRKRAQDLMAAALAFPAFPIVLETYRECLRDAYDVPALRRVLERIARREIRVSSVATQRPSPFAASLLFGFVATFLYDGDQPVAERRARALSLDLGRLRALLGEEELRALFEPDEIEQIERRLQCLEPRLRGDDADVLHDLCRRLGCLTLDEITPRIDAPADDVEGRLAELVDRRRLVPVTVAGARRYIVIEDVARYRDALGVVPPPGTPATWLEPATDPLTDLVARYARTHGPFTAETVAQRFGIGPALARGALDRLAAADRVFAGAFRPGHVGTEYCDAEVLRALKRHVLARLRAAVEPVSAEVYAQFLAEWQGVVRPRRGLDALLGVIEHLQGVPLPASVLETEILPARIADYTPGMLDALCVAGEVVWQGVESIGERDGRIALYLTDAFPRLAPVREPLAGPAYDALRAVWTTRGAVFFTDLARAVGGFPRDVEGALWALIWNGEVSNDTLAPLRSRLRGAARASGASRRRGAAFGGFTSRRSAAPGTEGRFSWRTPASSVDATERTTARALLALERDGVLVREAALGEGLSFSDAYPVLKAFEEAGRLRRGYFVEGLGATQFALPGADERLRAGREASVSLAGAGLALSACDPANPYGAVLPWPRAGEGRLQRVAGATVVLVGGRLCGYLGRGGRALTLAALLPEAVEDRPDAISAVAHALGDAIDASRLAPVSLTEIDGTPVAESPGLAAAFGRAGFDVSRTAFTRRRVRSAGAPSSPSPEPGDDDDVFDGEA